MRETRERAAHYVSTEPFNPYSVENLTPEQERFYLASQWRMMWWKLKRHRIAVLSGAILLAMYVAVARQRGLDTSALTGTIQNDILKEYVARGTYIFPPAPSMRLITFWKFVGRAHRNSPVRRSRTSKRS